MTTISLEQFSDLLNRSGLVDSVSLASLPDRYDGTSAKSFAEYLVANDILTRWQAESLLAGRYKGFVFEGYKVLEFVGNFERGSRYRAKNIKTGKLVVLAVVAKQIATNDDGTPIYTVEEVL